MSITRSGQKRCCIKSLTILASRTDSGRRNKSPTLRSCTHNAESRSNSGSSDSPREACRAGTGRRLRDNKRWPRRAGTLVRSRVQHRFARIQVVEAANLDQPGTGVSAGQLDAPGRAAKDPLCWSLADKKVTLFFFAGFWLVWFFLAFPWR